MVETKLDVVLSTENITVPYKYKSEIDVRIDNAKDKLTSVKFSGLPNLVQAEFVNSTFGHGQIVILSLLESDDIRVGSNFDESILDYEILKNRGINVIRFLLRENPTAETRKISIDISVPGSTQTLSISIRQKGAREETSMRNILKAFFEGTEGYPEWLNTYGWCTDKPLQLWYGISSVFIEKTVFKGNVLETYVGLTDLWNIDLNWNYLAGKIPQIFWDNFKYIGYLDIKGAGRCQLNDTKELLHHADYDDGQTFYSYELPNNVFHENLMGINLGSIYLRGNNLERFYECPNIQVLSWGYYTIAPFRVDERMLNWKNLQILDISGKCNSGHIPQNIGELKHLKDIHCSNLSGTFPESMYELENLESFVISGEISGTLSQKVANWKNLEEFQLIETKMSGKIPEEFGMLPKLRLLELEGNHFDTESLPEFYRYWPTQNGNWGHGAFDSYYPEMYQNNNDNVYDM